MEEERERNLRATKEVVDRRGKKAKRVVRAVRVSQTAQIYAAEREKHNAFLRK